MLEVLHKQKVQKYLKQNDYKDLIAKFTELAQPLIEKEKIKLAFNESKLDVKLDSVVLSTQATNSDNNKIIPPSIPSSTNLKSIGKG